MAEESPFAGHPTIGTSHALLDAGLVQPTNGKVYQQCRIGLVELTFDGDHILFKLTRAVGIETPPDALEKVQAAFGNAVLALAIYDVGPVWHTAQLQSADTVLLLEPDLSAILKLSKEYHISGIQTIGAHTRERCYEVRNFAPADGIIEDPACGSGAGVTAAHLHDFSSLTDTLELIQGTAINRASKLTANASDGISVGGSAVVVITGTY